MVLISLAIFFDLLLTIWIDKKASDSRLSNEGTPDNSNDTSVGTNIAPKKPKHGPSDYELKKQANIEENRKLLAGLGLSNGGSSAILGNSLTNKKKGEKEERYAFCLFCIVFPTII